MGYLAVGVFVFWGMLFGYIFLLTKKQKQTEIEIKKLMDRFNHDQVGE